MKYWICLYQRDGKYQLENYNGKLKKLLGLEDVISALNKGVNIINLQLSDNSSVEYRNPIGLFDIEESFSYPMTRVYSMDYQFALGELEVLMKKLSHEIDKILNKYSDKIIILSKKMNSDIEDRSVDWNEMKTSVSFEICFISKSSEYSFGYESSIVSNPFGYTKEKKPILYFAHQDNGMLKVINSIYPPTIDAIVNFLESNIVKI